MSDSSKPSNSSRSAESLEGRPNFLSAWAQPIMAVAFDMDGLLVNTEELYTEVGQAILSRRGKEFTRELKNAMTGLPGPKAFELMISREQLTDSVEVLAKESAEIFAGILPTKVRVLPGVDFLLNLLDQHKIPRCVATSSSYRFAEEVLKRVQVFERFHFVLTAEDVQHGKPAPDIYQLAAERMNVATENMLVLEDSHHGARAGVASGACTIAVPGDHSESHDFHGVHFRANTLNDPYIARLLSPAN
jgi:HAD superfamily hydrolase (TIGR01509 family)